MSWFEALWQVVAMAAGVHAGSAMTGVAAGILLITLAVAALLVGVPAKGADAPATRRLLRGRSARAGVPRHRDPDAPGRTRPRGPTGAASAA